MKMLMGATVALAATVGLTAPAQAANYRPYMGCAQAAEVGGLVGHVKSCTPGNPAVICTKGGQKFKIHLILSTSSNDVNSGREKIGNC